MDQIHSVDAIKIYEMSDGRWGIDAQGQVSRGSPRRTALVAHSGIIDPDGDLHYDFMAEPPTGITTPAFARVSAHGTFGGRGTDIRGLRRIVVHGYKKISDADFTG